MFERNDKALLTTRVIVMVVIGFFVVASFAGGIALAVLVHGALFLVTFVGWFFCWLMWVFARLYMSYLVDIKLIRNKLYGESNEDLEVFLKGEEERSNSPKMQEKRKETEAELQRLRQLLSSGIITAEEYEKRREELTKDI